MKDYYSDDLTRRLRLGFTPSEARTFIRDIEDAAAAEAYREVRAVIEEELQGEPRDPDDQFDAGTRAAYHFVLSRLAAAEGDDPPDASHHLFPASVRQIGRTVWSKLAEISQQYLKKGSLVYIEG